jgi:phage-related baseplate assembly protein
VFHARSAHPDVLDASAPSPVPGEVYVTVLSRLGDGTASPEVIDAVAAS